MEVGLSLKERALTLNTNGGRSTMRNLKQTTIENQIRVLAVKSRRKRELVRQRQLHRTAAELK